MKALLGEFRRKIEVAKVREVWLNKHLGHPGDYQKGTLVLTMRWSDAEKLLKLAEKGYAG